MKKKRFFIYVSIYFSLFTFIGISLFYLSKLNALDNHDESVDHTYHIMLRLNELEKRMLDAETGQRGFLLTRDSVFLEPYLTASVVIPQLMHKLKFLTSENMLQQRNVEVLSKLIDRRFVALREEMSPENIGKPQFLRLEKGRRCMEEIRRMIRRLRYSETYILGKRDGQKQESSSESRTSALVLLLLAFTVLCVAGTGIIVFFNRSHRYRIDLENSVHKLKDLNAEIAALTYASTHNLQEPMRKVQIVIDKLTYDKKITDPYLQDRMEKLRQIYSDQQQVNNTIVSYFEILTNEIRPVRIDLRPWLEAFFEKRPQLKVVLGPLEPIDADPYQLSLLFRHIADNSLALRYISRAPELHIHTYDVSAAELEQMGLEKKDFCALEITDTGTGLQENQLASVYELFLKPVRGFKKFPGLAFPRRIMINHGGGILVRNRLPYGLSVVLVFSRPSKV